MENKKGSVSYTADQIEAIMYCPFCDLETICIVSGSGNKFACSECGKEFSDEIISVSEVCK